jgi:hypothetical protein
MNIKRTLITTLLLTLSSAVFAADGYTIKVGKDFDVSAETGAITSVALGEHARADVSVAGIQVDNANVDIGGSFTSKVKTGAITAVALGKNVSARVNVGGIQQGGQP